MEMKVRNLMKKISCKKMMKKDMEVWPPECSGLVCINRVVPNHSLLKILTLPKIDNFINFVFILRLS